MPRMRALFPTLALGAFLAGCGMQENPDDSAAAENAAPATTLAPAHALAIAAADFAFAAPDTVPAGWTRITLTNNGPSLHHVQLVRLDDGHTLADLHQAMTSAGPPPAWAVFVGGPNAAVPGASAVGDVDLKPGNYAIICVIPDSTGRPHVMSGMARPLTVVSGPETAEPTADATVKLVDYGFEESAPLTAGHHVIRVENAGQQPHELVMVQLAPGKTAQDVATYVEGNMQGDPPGKPIGGVTGIVPGDASYFEVDLTPGDYAYLCFFPGPDGKPHVAHGMIRQFTVS